MKDAMHTEVINVNVMPSIKKRFVRKGKLKNVRLPLPTWKTEETN